MNDPYLYPNTEVLINKFAIKDDKTLNEMEAEYTSTRIKQLVDNPIDGNFDFNHFCKLHYFILF